MQMQTDYTVFMECTITDPGERRRRLATVYQCLLQADPEVGERVLDAHKAEINNEPDKCADIESLLSPIKVSVPL